MQPLLDALPSLTPEALDAVLWAGALDLLGLSEEVDEDDVVETLVSAGLDSGTTQKAVMKAAQTLLREASCFELTLDKMQGDLGKVGFSMDQAAAVFAVLARVADKREGQDAGADEPAKRASIAADTGMYAGVSRAFRVSDLFDDEDEDEEQDEEATLRMMRGSVFATNATSKGKSSRLKALEKQAQESGGTDAAASDGGSESGGLYDDLDEELAASPEPAASTEPVAAQSVGQFEFRHIEVPKAKVCQEWKEKGGESIYVVYEVKTYVTVRVELPPGELEFECDGQLMVTKVSPQLAFSQVHPGNRLVAFNDRPLGKGVPWSKVAPVISKEAGARAVTFALLQPFLTRRRCDKHTTSTKHQAALAAPPRRASPC
eukprot:COSAG01_NODE_1268_length_10965_cov_17.529266_8_plen_375_part_00